MTLIPVTVALLVLVPAVPAVPVVAAVPAARAPAVAAVTPTTTWRAPVAPVRLLRGFTVGPRPWSPGHRGVDLAATPGQEVRAPTPGWVVFAGSVAGTRVVVVAHADGLRSTFSPAVATGRTGDAVPAGAVVARVVAGTVAGAAHCPSTCLHWGVLRGPVYLDPWALLAGPVPVRLFPPGTWPGLATGSPAMRWHLI